MSIGAVLDELHKEFPEVTVSKVRFLESEGLVCPARTKSGYRRFSVADLDRLRYVLTTQRDNYLPLKVIKEQLDELDDTAVSAAVTTGVVNAGGAAGLAPVVTPEQFRRPPATRMTPEDLAEQAGVAPSFLTTLRKAKIISADASGFFTNEDVAIVQTCDQLVSAGIDERLLRQLRTAAMREADIITQAAGVIPTSKGDSAAREGARERSRELTALVVSLHALLVKDHVYDELGG